MRLKDVNAVNIILPTKLPNDAGIVDITGKVWLNKETYGKFLKQGKLMKVVFDSGEQIGNDLYIYIEQFHKDMPCGILED